MRAGTFFFLIIGALSLRADLVECENGDRYNGKVLLVDEQSVKLQNEIAGTLTIPRSKVVTISFRAPKNARSGAPGVSSGTVTNLSALNPSQPLKFDSASIEKVQNELLGDASPEANQMFREMVTSLMSGKMDMNDLRAKAQTTLNELKALQKDLGDDDAAALLNSYAGILENFIRQAPPAVPGKAGAEVKSPNPVQTPKQDE
jgi:hypothetical protein